MFPLRSVTLCELRTKAPRRAESASVSSVFAARWAGVKRISTGVTPSSSLRVHVQKRYGSSISLRGGEAEMTER